MDIKQLKYFISVVEADNNLSLASKKVHISQPALSRMIKSIEEEEDISLFYRGKGKLLNLTPVGELFYVEAQKVVGKYEEMIESLENANTTITGEIRIGIPPVIVSTVFGNFLPKFILENKKVKVTILEAGAYELKKALMMNEIDIAILLDPVDLSDVDTKVLVSDELQFYMRNSHPLANKKILSWKDLHKQSIALFDNSFMIHHLVKNAFDYHGIRPQIQITSSSWDYLLKSTLNTDLITILPKPIYELVNKELCVCKSIETPIIWNVMLTRKKKRTYRSVETFCYQEIIDYFLNESNE